MLVTTAERPFDALPSAKTDWWECVEDAETGLAARHASMSFGVLFLLI